ncbi:MAG: Stp1/IreP family PP2C-type Ser/Thr phosphatase [Chloroflexota bacterium]|nr:Stp1/IreP family PP2C-type Ser/Thr phosphatase [Chloroflexota bacterium]
MGGTESETQLRSGSYTSIGQVRENNEDNLHLWAASSYVLAVVADGMGGAAAGEEASRLAVEAIEAGLVSHGVSVNAPLDTPRPDLDATSEALIANKLIQAIRSGNQNIVNRAAIEPELRGMGTTVTLAFVRTGRAIVAHVGDSRAYLVEGGTGSITQITDDHSFVEALVAAGHLTPDQAEDHPMRNVLYRALGQNLDIDVDVYEAFLNPGDRVVLCSDGLTRHVKSREIAEVTLSIDDPEIASQALVDLANARGGEDNVSVIVIAIEGDGGDLYLQTPRELFDPDDTVDLRRIRPLITDFAEMSVRSELDSPTDQREGGDADYQADTEHTPPIAFDPAYERFLSDDAYEGRDTRVSEQ